MRKAILLASAFVLAYPSYAHADLTKAIIRQLGKDIPNRVINKLDKEQKESISQELDFSKNLSMAVDLVDKAMKATGISGVAAMVDDCYNQVDDLSFCVTLDATGKYLDDSAVRTFGFPQSTYFETKKYVNRIYPIIGQKDNNHERFKETEKKLRISIANEYNK